MKKILFTNLLAISSLATVINAQEHNISSLDSVEIRDNRIRSTYANQNRNIQILDNKQIQSLPVKSTNELLSYVAGVDLQQRGPWGAQADVSIDGSTFDEVLVLVNGVKMSDPQTGHNMLNIPIPLSSIDHIEVISGPASREYGVNALVGAINIVTRLPKETEVSAQIYTGSSFKKDTSTGKTYYGWGAQAAAAIAGNNQSHILSYAHDESNGYLYNSGFHADRVFYQDHFTLSSKSAIEAMGGYVYDNYGANGFYSAPIDKNAVETSQNALGSIAYIWRPVNRLTITPRVSYVYDKDDYIFIRQAPSVYRNIHNTNVLTGEVQSSLQMNHGVLGAGVEVRNEEIRSTNLGKHQRNNTGIYAEYKHYFSNDFNVSGGLYGNYNSDYGLEIFPSIDAGYRIVNHLKLFANASTGERLPTYTDLYYAGPTNIGDSLLKPEHTTYGEAGIKYDIPDFMITVSYFYRHITDFIDWQRTSATNPWQPQNFVVLNTPGLKAQATYQLSRALHLPGAYSIILNGSYCYLTQDIQVPEGKVSQYAIQALRNQAVISVRTLFIDRIQFEFNGRYLQRIDGNDYTLLDTRIGYKWHKWNVYADINNLLDVQYKEIQSVQLPGRWYTIGLKYGN